MSTRNLIIALMKADLITAKRLINSGVDINLSNELGQFPLVAAIGSGEPKVIDFFIENGGNINQDLGNGWTALHEAIDGTIDSMIQEGWEKPDSKMLKIIETIVSYGGLLTSKTARGHTPLDLLSLYAGTENGLTQLKDFFRPLFPDIDSRITIKPRLT